jgi:outer membrane biosynthesis protein TonB
MASLPTMASLKSMVSTRWSLVASATLHLAIVATGLVALPSLDTYKVEETESIPVEIVEIEDLSKRQAVSKTAEEKPKEPVAPPKVEEAETPKPAPVAAREVEIAAREPEAEPPLPELEPLDELAKEAAEPEPLPAPEPEPKKVEAKPVPVPKAKPEPPKRVVEKPKPEFNADEMQALLNKIDETSKAPPKPADLVGQPKLAEFDSLTGSDERLAADLVDALRHRIESCWTLPAGARDAQDLQIRLQFALNPDGTLSDYPVVMNASAHPAFDAAARSAQSAIKTCEPYNFLPVEKYDLWRDIILTFDPSRIFALN